ncbi:hypothetical protein GYMLUDRAFT_637942 [Collybiopsis luxurians FD-317 M1]|nr:hypothetical protein GYMLUDRAFT_637942 [Collybiopsis luxurians FD-317 M1]
MTTPILLCPNETLTEIFRAYIKLPASKQHSQTPSHARLPAVVLLSHVCGQWRRLVNGTPSLWFSLSIKVGKTYPEVDLIRSWIQRGGSRPFDLAITKTQSNMATSRLSTTYLDFLVQFSARLQSLDIDMDFQCIKHLFESKSLRLPLLNSLHLQSTAKVHARSAILRSIKNAPRLSHFTFIAPQYSPEVFIYLPASSSITTLNLSGISRDPIEFLNIIFSCPLLETCELAVPDVEESDLPEEAIIWLAHLSQMTLHFVELTGCPEFLDAFTLPKLTSLTIKHDYVNPHVTNPIAHLSGLIGRSECPLLSLTLDSFPGITLCCLAGLLMEIPTLEYFSFIDCFLHIPSICSILVVKPDDGFPILPNLLGLTLLQNSELGASLGPVFKFDDGIKTTIFDVARSRWEDPLLSDKDDIDGFYDEVYSRYSRYRINEDIEPLQELTVSSGLLMGTGSQSDRAKLEELETQGLVLDII